ncbi:hypothetical protein EDB81DRAFT_896495 [Dactylonectria macrodidyma]|uniref:NACHT domain-containing protein n=1 Tax=Dactylonectria macrodidyma TaxID=307937 RepID=A0A9P9FUY0_9HYPO|nr:hypothetical protein EDB81DRAFT_896495 [Dactylonectria macrodidyma]
MAPRRTRNGGFRLRLRTLLHRLRRSSRNREEDVSIESSQNIQEGPDLATNSDSTPQDVTSTAGPLPCNQDNSVIPEEPTSPGDVEAHDRPDRVSLYATHLHKGFTTFRPAANGRDSDVAPSDLWSAAYREAVASLGEDIDIAILKGNNVAQLFRDLEEIGVGVTQQSAFLRGVKYLQSIQVPLERFKLALDLASPLTSLEPTATTVFGVVKSVTALAISFATADLEFAKQIAEMLEQISYIDDCNTLGQKADKVDIHKALVSVYRKLLEFYQAGFEILTNKGAKFVITLVLENDRLPNIAQDFLRHADTLRKLVQKATWEIVDDIKAMLYDREIARWLGSEKLVHQSRYHAYFQDLRADQACEFLLTNAELMKWYRASNSQHLVLLGDMGSGKTVSMAFLVDELSRRNEHQLPQPKLCFYYCRDDETGQAVSILSALLLSLLEQLPGLKRKFFEWYKQAQALGDLEPAINPKKLEAILHKVLETIDRPVFFVIDGLDECDRASRNLLLKFLKTSTQRFPRLKTILSSRPQEEILEQIDGMAKIDLGSDPVRDGVIVEKIVEKQLFYLSQNVKAFVTDSISRLAQGSAIWSKIIGLIEGCGIRALGSMQRFINRLPLPGQLSQLYITLLAQYTSNDPENHELATTALKVLAIARRPLSILELAWAVALGTAQHEVTTVAALAGLVDHQRVMNFIHPFISRVDFSDVKKRQVQLVHQSVKEFVIQILASNPTCLQTPSLSAAVDKALHHRHVERLDAFALGISIRYLRLSDICATDLFSDEQVAIEALPQDVHIFDDDEISVEHDPNCASETLEENMIRYDPTDRGFGELFNYASCHWIEHFGAVTTEPLPSLSSIENLCQAGSTQLHNWIQQNCRPNCTIKHRFQFDSSLHDPLSITSLYGSEAMLRHMLENSDFDEDKFLPDTALGAADQILQWGDLPRLSILLESKLGHQLQNLDLFRLIIQRWSNPVMPRNTWDAAFDLIGHVLKTLVQGRWGNELLCLAANAGWLNFEHTARTQLVKNPDCVDATIVEPTRYC